MLTVNLQIFILWTKRHNIDFEYFPNDATSFEALESMALEPVEVHSSNAEVIKFPKLQGEFSNLKYLKLAWFALDEIPTWIGDCIALEELNIYGNNISEIPSWLEKLPKLKKLDCSLNQIRELPQSIETLEEFIFEDVHLLAWQSAFSENTVKSYNKYLEAFPHGEYVENALKKLDLKKMQVNNKKKTFTLYGKITNKSRLGEISGFCLQNHHLKRFPKGLCDTRSLRKLTIGKNKIMEIPKEIGNLRELEKLSIYKNPIKELPKSMGKLNALTHLVIGGLDINDFPESFKNLSNLVRLEFIKNKNLYRIPDVVGELKNLEKLELSGENFYEISSAITKLKNLISLKISCNNVQFLPYEMGQLEKLEILDLDFSNIKFLPKSIGKLKKLKKMIISSNQLDSLPETIGGL